MDPMRSGSAYTDRPKKRSGCFARGCTGCSLGCGLLMLLFFVAGYITVRWLFATADIPNPFAPGHFAITYLLAA